MKYSVCIDSVFGGRDFLESMTILKDAGFDTFEFWTWCNKDIDAINALRKKLGMHVSTFCVPFVSLVDTKRIGEYKNGLMESIEIARELDCEKLITQVGNSLPELGYDVQKSNLINGLKACAPILEQSGITLLFEPLNTHIDHKGYFLSDSDTAYEIHDRINSPNIKVLYDIYHQLVMGEDVKKRILANIDKIGHFHAAGYPGRHELGSGSFNYAPLFESISESPYEGYMGIEYMPLLNPENGLAELGNINKVNLT